MTKLKTDTRIAIVGGGLVGSLAACYFAKRGFPVSVYEYREDIRKEDSRGQSIDLALSVRGREALRGVGLEDALVANHGIAMKGRMLHSIDGDLKEVIYDNVYKNCIYSVSRKHLNVVLLNAAEKYPNVELNFNLKLIDSNLEEGTLKFLNMKNQKFEYVTTDLIIGADGAHSTVRKIMIKRPLFNCSQTYIEHGYVELFVPATAEGKYVMSGNHLHIWPRGDFMMIALPNDDKTFTGNLFAPFSTIEKLHSPRKLLAFYEEQFPDLLRMIGEEKLVKDFFQRDPKNLVSIKCEPYHVGNKAVIIGDAAHAMVPFYAQGMNTAFEDVLILDELMDLYDCDMTKVFEQFSKRRCEDAHIICDLAMYNYLEMRDLVTKRSFLIRKYFDEFLYRLFPNTWIPLYSTIHFTRMSFRQCMINKKWQDNIIRNFFWYVQTITILITAILIYRVFT